MKDSTIEARLAFLRRAERLKDTLRSAHTSEGRQESVAEHSWRLLLLVMTFADLMPRVDCLRLLKICVLHDLGEAVHGDIPAPQQDCESPKASSERADFVSLLDGLPERLKTEFLGCWDEYEDVSSDESSIAKAFDKIETLLQHNQGKNPPGFDYEFNLDYGRKHTDRVPLAAQIRELIDADTKANSMR